MRVDEEKALKSAMDAISSFGKEHTQLWAFLNQVEEINIPSIQNASYESDLDYFKRVAFVLSVIQTIAHKPHFVVKVEETIVRADQAGSLSNESFQKTLRDPALWKQKKDGMSPEHVHHTESLDNIRIYENIFVVMVLKNINRTLHHYQDYYANSVKSVNQDELTVDGDRILYVFATLKKLFQKIDRIKRTDFYRKVNEGPTNLRHVQATNILKHDRLYNVVYRFYHDMNTYDDEKELIADLLSYYYILLLRSLKKAGIKLAPSSNRARTSGKTAFFAIPKQTRFYGKGLFLTLTKNDYHSLLLTIALESNRDIEAKHYLYINSKYSFGDFLREGRKLESDADTVEALSVWSLAHIEAKSVEVMELGAPDDHELMDRYLESKILTMEGSHNVYVQYCPSCRNLGVTARKGVTRCMRCSSRYALYKEEDKDKVFFLRLRRA